MSVPDFDPSLSLGFPALTDLFGNMIPGDNVVWNLDSVEDFMPLAKRYVDGAKQSGKYVVYFRYAKHDPLVQEGGNVSTVPLKLDQGFEFFVTGIHRAIDEATPNTYFLFDLLSSLTDESISERMLGNFFSLICPYIWDKRHFGYFPILRNHHPYYAAFPIENTTQILVDLIRQGNEMYIHPKKVEYRDSTAMFLVHRWDEEQLLPIHNSAETVKVLRSGKWSGLQSASYRMIGRWDRSFMQAEELLEKYEQSEIPKEVVDEYLKHLLPQIISLDKKILELYSEYIDLSDLIEIWKRTIGSGAIGGKSAGMLLARAIIRKNKPDLLETLEEHDSFFIGSDIYYSFLVENDCWWIRKKQQNPDTLFEETEEVQARIMAGTFPDSIVKQFSDLLDYMGQMPVIVRSSSLLEDNFGNAFAGQYESVFCTNQGERQHRLDEFIHAVKVVYASAMSTSAVAYRNKRGILDQDEQMALLVQRVSGAQTGNYFYPHLSGVGLSYNPYIWNPKVDPKAGALRLVYGLGTRAVNRHDDDYALIVALNLPDIPPAHSGSDARNNVQKKVDVLNLKDSSFESKYFVDLAGEIPDLDPQKFAVIDTETQRRIKETTGRLTHPWRINFHRTFKETSFFQNMRSILKTLKEAYDNEVEIEYTGTCSPDGSIKINLVQCRPFQIEVTSESSKTPLPGFEERNSFIEAKGAILGRSRTISLDRIIYVSPSEYSELPQQQRYQVANLVSKLTALVTDGTEKDVMLLGPGRWGTSMPSLGVPVSPTAIKSVRVVCEMDIMHEGLVPDLSLGTHFFHELVEMDILYMGFFKSREGNWLNTDLIESAPNELAKLIPDEESWANVVTVIDATEEKPIYLVSNLIEQSASVFTTAD